MSNLLPFLNKGTTPTITFKTLANIAYSTAKFESLVGIGNIMEDDSLTTKEHILSYPSLLFILRLVTIVKVSESVTGRRKNKLRNVVIQVIFD